MLIFPTVLLLLQKEFSLGYLELGIISNIMSLTYGLGALPGGMITTLWSKKALPDLFPGFNRGMILWRHPPALSC